MITVEVGGESRSLEEATEKWIAHGVNKKFTSGGTVCVRVVIKTSDVQLALSTPGCGGGGGGGWQPNSQESKIIALWQRRGLGKADYTVGDVISFLKQVETYV